MSGGKGSKVPWFALYAADFVTSTQRMTDEQVGAYMRLLCDQWINGPVPIDDLRQLARISDSAVEHIDLLRPKFPNGLNPRLDAEWQDALKRSDTARRKAAKRWQGQDQDSSESLAEQGFDDDGPLPDNADAYAPADAAAYPGAGAAASPQHMPFTPTPTVTDTDTDTATKPRPTQRRETPKISDADWSRFRAAYPDRQGGQGWKAARERMARAVAAGTAVEDIIAGAERYRAQCEHAGIIGQSVVKQAQTFCNPQAEHWTEEYPIVKGNKRLQSNARTAEDWADGSG